MAQPPKPPPEAMSSSPLSHILAGIGISVMAVSIVVLVTLHKIHKRRDRRRDAEQIEVFSFGDSRAVSITDTVSKKSISNFSGGGSATGTSTGDDSGSSYSQSSGGTTTGSIQSTAAAHSV